MGYFDGGVTLRWLLCRLSGGHEISYRVIADDGFIKSKTWMCIKCGKSY